MALVALVYFAAAPSGAHLNPAVSLALATLGHVTPFEMMAYWVAQVSGCIVGALGLALLVPGLHVRGALAAGGHHDGCFTPARGVSDAQVVGWEAVCTATFIAPVLAVVWCTTRKAGYGSTGPLVVGLSLAASALAAGPFTGGALNPARALASPAVFDCPRSRVALLYVVGELCGALLAALVARPWYAPTPLALAPAPASDIEAPAAP